MNISTIPNSLIYTEWDLAQIHMTGESFPVSESLARYYLLYWDYAHLISQIRFTSSGVQLSHQGITYDARIFPGEDWLEFSNSKRVCLSFRAWPDSRTGELTGVVLVKRAC